MATQTPRAKTLKLTEVESTLRQLLLDVAQYIDNSPIPSGDESQHAKLPEELAKAKLELRFTGGWVRDKLLGVESHDIDVAINKMTGYQFGLRMNEYLRRSGNAKKYKVGGLHKIDANPEKSKHLETVTTRILGLDIDLVNLRKETYTEDSRNPQMEFGTPEEDALRRDATVNAMFYNLNTEQIEDFTGKGFEDMQLKVIRTPLEPYQTFKDDPLRVLRLIRFASRLFYQIDPAAEEAMGNEDIKEALRLKISRERVGVELEKALRGPDPARALELIDRLGLYSTIFTDPTKDYGWTPQSKWTPTYEYAGRLLGQTEGEDSSYATVRSTLIRDADEKYLAWTLSAIVPWADAPEQQPARPGSRPPPPVATSVAREGFKAPNKVCDIVTASIKNLEEIRNMKDALVRQKTSPQKQIEGEDPAAPDVIGMTIRRWGPTWRSQVVFAILYEVLNKHADEDAITKGYATFISHISSLNLTEAYALKPLLDGKALAKALSTPPGPWMKSALDVVMVWQLRNPGVTDPSAAIEEVKNQRSGELIPALASHILRLTIRPLFAQTPRPQPRVHSVHFGEENEEAAKPWKKPSEAYALDLLRWVLTTMSTSRVEKEWPMLVPPILTLIDDSDTAYKATGCVFLKLLLEATPPPLLHRTGLADVFEDAVMPCLSYLPTLTPEPESITLLDAAYPALITLAHTRFPRANNDTNPEPIFSPASAARAKLLDRILRHGILFSFAHAGMDHARLATTLCHHLRILIQELGIESVKHLSSLIPLLSNVLSEPLGSLHPPLLAGAARALQEVMLNAWPRVGDWRGEVLKGVCVCWVGLRGEGVAEVEKELRMVVQVLERATGEEVGLREEMEALLRADERLKELFGGLGEGL
ncbi:hypothetical protein K490DRAFT_52041 [Saccharata proteae CBS 121410]|uniref:Poly A polymerase C-terminal region-like protein n=1 Tax=Saccharata proteae CBS 121410 TaxID=1314787 RepID=A0A9P4LTR7_9PEZI|nr:hypothetical protein K490DRAFT_52041 [Saccharata proteae CBS 121410]